MAAGIRAIDHVVLTAGDLESTVAFYCDVLGLEIEEFGEGRFALTFGDQKINLHQSGQEFEPKAARPAVGGLDICFLTETPIGEVQAGLEEKGVHIEQGPVPRAGATGPLMSIYLRDPDGNLVEIANRV
jgi:catechol 2,3-dioxygenase-like lactoylglutathione lyase family enzyme